MYEAVSSQTPIEVEIRRTERPPLTWVERRDSALRMLFLEATDDEGHVTGLVAIPQGRVRRFVNDYVTWTCLTAPCYGSAIRAHNPDEAMAMLTEHCRVAH